MTTATRVEPDADDLRDAECDHCCGTGAVIDSVSSGEWSSCPACRPDEPAAQARHGTARGATGSIPMRTRSSAEGSDSGIRTSRSIAGSGSPRPPSIDPEAAIALEDLRAAVEDARTYHAHQSGRTGGASDVDPVVSLADRALEYLEAEGSFREASCAVMRGASPASVDLPACARRVAIAEVALRTVASAGSRSSVEVDLDPANAAGACVDRDAPDSGAQRPARDGSSSVGSVDGSGGDGGRRVAGRWWSRLWPRSRTVSVRSGGDLI